MLGDLYMFLDQLDERNTTIQSIFQFEEVEKIGLTSFENRLSLYFLLAPSKLCFPY